MSNTSFENFKRTTNDKNTELSKIVLDNIRESSWFPFKTGNLKWRATYIVPQKNGFDIVFSLKKAFYIDFLEYGTKPHLIPNAFGRGITVMHPGSRKHVGFIRVKSVNSTIQSIIQYTGGKIII